MIFEFNDVAMQGSNGRERLGLHHLRIPASGLTVIAGPSGAGKSSLLRLCNRLEVPTSGSIEFDSKPIETTPVLDLRRSVGMVFQEPVRFAGSVLNNLKEADPGVDRSTAIALLQRVGLAPEFLDRVADELSGGEAQRMCIARALATDPMVLLMDEPTSSLDPAATRTIEDLAVALTSSGIPMIWVTHDIEQMNRIASHVICLINGSVAYEGSAEGLMRTVDSDIVAFRSGEYR